MDTELKTAGARTNRKELLGEGRTGVPLRDRGIGGWEGGYGTKNSRSPYRLEGITGRGADRSSFRGYGNERADAELKMEEGAWRGQLRSEDRILRGL